MLGRFLDSSQKPQKVESRISTQEDLICPSSFVPDDFTIRLAFNIEYAMLRNELFIGQILLPRAQVRLQTSIESVLVSNCVVVTVKFGIPNEPVNDVCPILSVPACAEWFENTIPAAGRSLFSAEVEVFDVDEA